QLPRPVIIARDSEIKRATDISTKLEGVVAPGLQQVSNKLKLFFLLIQRAITTSGKLIETGAKGESSITLHEAFEKTGCEGVVEIQPGNSCIGRRSCPKIRR